MDGDNYNSPISSSSPHLTLPPSLLPMPSPEIYYSHTVIYFLQTCRKRLLPVLKELAGSQGFNDWGLVQWWGGEARGSVRIPPPHTHPRGSRTNDSYTQTLTPPYPYYRYWTFSSLCVLTFTFFFVQFLLFLSLFTLVSSHIHTEVFPLIPLPLFFFLPLAFLFFPLVTPPPRSKITFSTPHFPCPYSSMTYCFASQL